MEIEIYFYQLLSELDSELELVSPEDHPKLIRLESSFLVVEAKIKALKEFVLEYAFFSMEEEIHFFKELKPQILSKSIFYSELFNIEANRPIGTKKNQKQYLIRELGSIQRYMSSQHQLYNYMLLGKSNFDHLYFLRSNTMISGVSDGLASSMDERFCTPHCLALARINACLKINQHLHGEIESLKNGSVVVENQPALNWTAPKVYLIELIYALKASGVLNGGNAEIKEIALFMDALMPKKLTDYYRTFQEIRLRKKNRTVFLDLMKERLERWMEESEGVGGAL